MVTDRVFAGAGRLLVAILAVCLTWLPARGAEHAPGVPRAVTSCELTTGQKTANRLKPWADFEFDTETPGAPMWFAAQGCYVHAARSSEDYLANGPLLTVRQQAITIFHMGRNAAFSGDEKAAARIVAAARSSDQPAAGSLDWNAYVQGVHAFLVKDGVALDRAIARLSSSSLESDATNADNLRRLRAGFERGYWEAMANPDRPLP